MSKEDYLEQVAISLSQLSRFQAYTILNQDPWVDRTNGEKIFFLYQMNFSNNDIALIVGTTLGNVKKEISIRKK